MTYENLRLLVIVLGGVTGGLSASCLALCYNLRVARRRERACRSQGTACLRQTEAWQKSARTLSESRDRSL